MSSKNITIKISGMHCASCEVLIERELKKVAGIQKVKVKHTTGQAQILCTKEPSLQELQERIKPHGYTIGGLSEVQGKRSKKDHLETGIIFLIIVALYLILKQFKLVPDIGVSDTMSYGFVFLIGLAAATSTCLAVTGGLLLTLAAKYNERHINETGYGKFKLHLYFNLGRVISYTFFGGLIGLVGNAFAFSPRATGFVTVIASVIMIIVGVQLLKLPLFRWFHIRSPRFIEHKVHALIDSKRRDAPFLLGAGTFFLPCGFTQALQLYVLSKGDAAGGALVMLFFSLGTLPALLSLSFISSFLKARFQRYFLKVAGAVVLLLGFFNINHGLTLTGVSFNPLVIFRSHDKTLAEASEDKNVELVNGIQIVNMKVTGLDYSPYKFTVMKGVPVEWRIDGSGVQGCAQVITAPTLGITEYLPRQGIKTIHFTPKKLGRIPFSCTMGMTTPGAEFVVVENTKGVTGASVKEEGSNTSKSETGCDPDFAVCFKVAN